MILSKLIDGNIVFPPNPYPTVIEGNPVVLCLDYNNLTDEQKTMLLADGWKELIYDYESTSNWIEETETKIIQHYKKILPWQNLVTYDENDHIIIPFQPCDYTVPVPVNNQTCKYWILAVDDKKTNQIVNLTVLCLFFDADGNRTYIYDTVNYLNVNNDNKIWFEEYQEELGAYDIKQLVQSFTLIEDVYIQGFDLDVSDYLQDKESLIKRISI